MHESELRTLSGLAPVHKSCKFALCSIRYNEKFAEDQRTVLPLRMLKPEPNSSLQFPVLKNNTAYPRLQDEGIFRTLVESVRDYAIFMLDPEGVVATWNPGAERIKQYRASEIIG